MRWDESPGYKTAPDVFDGFYALEGNRTYVPNDFFDVLIPNEPLRNIKVTGAIVRDTIGWSYRGGHRRQHVALSFATLRMRTGIKQDKTLSVALDECCSKNYIVRVDQGVFDPNGGIRSKPTTYGLKWLDSATSSHIGSKSTAAAQSPADRFAEYSGNGSQNQAANRSDKQSDIEIKDRNKTSKKQQALAVESQETFQLLKESGFSVADAQNLANLYPADRIARQIKWLPLRNPLRNPCGLLRKAIENDYPAPVGVADASPSGQVFAAQFYCGLANYATESPLDASPKDALLAEKYVAGLLRIYPEEARVSSWGFQLGQYVAHRVRDNEAFQPNLAYALTASKLGVEFLKKVRHEFERRSNSADAREREAHRRRFERAYFQFLNDQQRRLRSHEPERYLEFQSKRETKRSQIAKYHWLSDEARERQLANHNSEENLRFSFAEFIDCDFWSWDTKHNPDSYDANRHAA